MLAYQGKDGYYDSYKDGTHGSQYKFQWENYTTLLRWNYMVSPSLFVNTSVYYSLFRFDESTEVNDSAYKETTRSGLADYSIKGDFDLSLNKRTLKFGYHFSSQNFNPELVAFGNEIKDTSFNASSIEKVASLAVYIEDEWKLNQNWTLKPGLRTLYYYNGIEGIFFLEPKFSTVYILNTSSSMKFSFQRMTQPIHLLTNTALNMPTDLWVPATHQIKPATAWQFDIEYAKKFSGAYSLTWDAYYKPIRNVIQYKQGVSYIKNASDAWYDLVDVGDGLNYGTEIMLEKTEGKITGWVNYTLAWALRKVEGINNGEYFPFKYDRRHDINVLLKYNVKETEQVQRYISVAFKLATGNAITVPVESFEGASLPGMNNLDQYFRVNFNSYESFPHPNNYRMPTFHHLDLAYSTTKKLSRGRERSWKFSVYNIYNRLNPYYYVKRYNGYYQVSLLPIIPSVSFSYNW